MNRLLPLTALIALASACAPSDDAFSPRNDGEDAPVVDDDADPTSRVLGRTGSDAATDVRAVHVEDDGTTTLIGEASIEVDGSFVIDVDADEEDVVLDALDADGRIVASAIVAVTAEEGGEVDVGPLTEETSVEAEVLLALRIEGSSEDEVSTADVQLRIDADIAAAAWDADDASEVTRDLALALDVAAGVTAEAEERGEDAFAAVVSTEAAFRAALTSSMDDAETRSAAIVASARLEAEATADALFESGADLSAELGASLEGLAYDLVEDMEEARDEADVDAAFDAHAEAVFDLTLGASGDEDEFDLLSELGIDIEIDLGALFEDAIDAGRGFSADVSADLDAALSDGFLDESEREDMSGMVLDAYVDAVADLQTALRERGGDEVSDSIVADILVEAMAHARTGE